DAQTDDQVSLNHLLQDGQAGEEVSLNHLLPEEQTAVDGGSHEQPVFTSPGAVPEAFRTEIPTRVDRFPATPSQAMGLDPNAGPMSSAAALAVDSGASPAAHVAALDSPALEGEW